MAQIDVLMMVYDIIPAMRPYAIEYEKGMNINVTNAGIESPGKFQFMANTPRIIMQPTRMSAPPVAQGGMDAKMGAKKREMKKSTPVVMAVRPVRPPS
jgi:hypothetical protein